MCLNRPLSLYTNFHNKIQNLINKYLREVFLITFKWIQEAPHRFKGLHLVRMRSLFMPSVLF